MPLIVINEKEKFSQIVHGAIRIDDYDIHHMRLYQLYKVSYPHPEAPKHAIIENLEWREVELTPEYRHIVNSIHQTWNSIGEVVRGAINAPTQQ